GCTCRVNEVFRHPEAITPDFTGPSSTGAAAAACGAPRRAALLFRRRVVGVGTMPETRYAVCNFCDAMFGLAAETDGRQLLAIRGDEQDPFSRGHICPKATAHQDLFNDPDRLRQPMRRTGDRWEAISWDAAITEVSQRIVDVQRRHGNDALAL